MGNEFLARKEFIAARKNELERSHERCSSDKELDLSQSSKEEISLDSSAEDSEEQKPAQPLAIGKSANFVDSVNKHVFESNTDTRAKAQISERSAQMIMHSAKRETTEPEMLTKLLAPRALTLEEQVKSRINGLGAQNTPDGRVGLRVEIQEPKNWPVVAEDRRLDEALPLTKASQLSGISQEQPLLAQVVAQKPSQLPGILQKQPQPPVVAQNSPKSPVVTKSGPDTTQNYIEQMLKYQETKTRPVEKPRGTPADLEVLKQQLIHDEGVRQTVYKCSTHHKTIGVGHLLTKADTGLIGRKLTAGEITTLFEKDFEKHRASVAKHYTHYPEKVQYIMINMSFQLGETGLQNFKQMHAAIARKDYAAAARHMKDSLWYKQTQPSRKDELVEQMLRAGDF